MHGGTASRRIGRTASAWLGVGALLLLVSCTAAPQSPAAGAASPRASEPQPAGAPATVQQSLAGGQLQPLKIGISTVAITTLPVWLAQSGGFFKQQGFDAEIVNMEGGSRGLQVLVSGEILAMHVGLAPLVLGAAAGADLRLVASTSNTIPFALVGTDAIRSPADLKGKAVGISRFGSESDIAVSLALRELGLTRQDVEIIQIGGTGARLAALETGQVGAVPLLEPNTTQAKDQGLKVMVDLGERKTPWVFDSVVVQASALQRNRGEITRLLRAYIEGAYWALSKPEEAKKVIAETFRVQDQQVIDVSYQEFARLMPLDARPSRDGARSVIEQLEQLNLEVGSKDVNSYLDTTIIDQLERDGFLRELQQKYNVRPR